MTTDSYAWWTQALRGVIPPLVESEPQAGYYRIRNSAGGWDPLAIWINPADGKTVLACRGHEGPPNVDPLDVWTWAAKYPVPYATYVAVARRGEAWPFSVEEEPAEQPGETPPHEALGIRLAAVRTHADLWLQSIGGELKTQDHADKAAAYAERLAKLKALAEETFTKEKRPHLEAGREVDNRWRNVRESIDANVRWVKALAAEWVKAERRRNEEAARKANEEARARAAEEHAKAVAEAQARGQNEPVPEPVVAPVVEAAPVRAGGRGVARAISTRKVTRCEITDMKALAAYIAALDHPPEDFVAECRKVAMRLLQAGVAVPGAKLTTDEVAS